MLEDSDTFYKLCHRVDSLMEIHHDVGSRNFVVFGMFDNLIISSKIDIHLQLVTLTSSKERL